MKWEIIRNEEKEIIIYKLTNNIYIERKYTTSFTSNQYYNTLIINNIPVLWTGTGSGYTLKDLKEKGENYLKTEEQESIPLF